MMCIMNLIFIKDVFKDIYKHRGELTDSKRRNELIKRWWRIYVMPPPETNVYIDLERQPEIFRKSGFTLTADQPKQVALTNDRKTALVSCMSSRKLQFFEAESLQKTGEIDMEEQCVEVITRGDLAFATTTNFVEQPPFHNKLWVVDIPNQRIVSGVKTEGNWSKVIAITPDGLQALVSNWQSNSISVINIANPEKPTVTQVVPLRKCPRGIAFTSDGGKAIVANFYSGNIAELAKVADRWKVIYESEMFDQPRYPGNPRHVLISPNNHFAYISNKGRNLIHVWSIPERRFVTSYSVGKGPNTIDYFGHVSDQLIVSCSHSDRVCLLDLKTGKVLGVSPKTGENTTGMCALSETEFLATGFNSNSLEKFTLTNR